MDVVCERCSTEYEFDDALVSERGTTVKCTNCSHQFKIYRPSSDPEAAKVWNLRRQDGSVLPFESLSALQKWILEGRVTKHDEISRAGEPWKRLGAIAELDSFFATAELHAAQVPAAPRGTGRLFTPHSVPKAGGAPAGPVSAGYGPQGSAPPSGAGGTLRPPAAVPPPVPNLPTATARGGSGRAPPGPPAGVHVPPPARMPAEAAMIAGHSQLTPPPAREASGQYSLGAAPVAPVEEFALGEAPRSASDSWSDGSLQDIGMQRPKPAIGPPPRSGAAPVRAVDPGPVVRQDIRQRLPADEDPTADTTPGEIGLGRTEPRRPLLVYLLGGVLITGLVGAATYSWKAGLLTGRSGGTATATTPGNAQVAALIQHARSLAMKSTRTAYEDAREDLTRALALEPGSARALAIRAGVMAAWSELLKQRAEDREARAAQPGEDVAAARAEAALSRREAGEKAGRARTDQQAAERALATTQATERAAIEAILADVSRVLGDVVGAQRHLETARTANVQPCEVALYSALLERETGAVAQAIEHLRAAATCDPDHARARIALARLLAPTDAAGAAAELERVVQSFPGHEEALALTQALARNEPPMQHGAVAVVPGTGPAAPNALVPGTPGGATVPTTGPAPVGPGATAAAGTGGGNYETLVEEGERLQTDGRIGPARERFQRALALRPSGAEALTGLGYVEMDQGNLSAAVARFRAALGANPNYSEAMIGMGEAYSSQRSYQQALDAYNQYLQVNPGGSRAGMARRQIESLQERLRQQRGSTPGTSGGTEPGTGAPATGPGVGSEGSTHTPAPAPPPADPTPTTPSPGS